MSFLETLVGKRTYLIVALGIALNVAVVAKWITVDQIVDNISQLNTILGLFGLGFLRAGVNSSTK